MSNIAVAAVKIAGYTFDETDWHLTGTVLDNIGGHNGVVNGSIGRNRSDSTTAHPNTCASASFGGGSIDISGLPVSTTAGDKTTVSFWMYWTGANSIMPIGWNVHDLWMVNGDFGFNTGQGDIYGISSAGLANGWHHVVAEFTNNNVLNNKIYIDGVDQVLTQRRSSPNNARAVVQSSLRLGGWYISNGYRFSGFLDEVNVYNGALTQAEVNIDFNYAHVGACPADPAPQPEQLIASYNFNDDWSSASPLVDSIGTADGNVSGNLTKILSPASGNKPETCTAGNFNGGAIDILNLPVSTTVGDKTSISFWMNWNGTNSVMPLGWRYHDLWFVSGHFGFNTAGGDIYGIASNTLINTWRHVTVVFTNNNVFENKIYIDGVEQTLTHRRGTINNSRAVVDQHLRIGGWWISNGYRFRGQLDEIKIYTGKIDQATIDANRTAVSACYTPVAEYRFDETSWTGGANTVIDSSLNLNHGNASSGTTPVQGLLCNAADFDGTNSIEVTRNSILDQIGKDNEDYSVSFWLKLDALQLPSWRAIIQKGNESPRQRTFSAWFNPGTNYIHHRASTTSYNNEGIFQSSYALQANKWEHIALIKEGNTLKTYINGSLDSRATISDSINNFGSLYLGDTPWYNGMAGLMDELLIFRQALPETEINNIIQNQLNAKNWDGQARNCLTPAIDHFEISYPDNALTCTPASITIKACTNADCSALYTPNVDVTLSPAAGWTSNPVTISNGTTTLDLTHTVAEAITVDVTDSSIVPANPIQCIEGLNIDPACSINFAETGFVFDVPTLTACKASADVTIRAVKKSDTGVQCVGALAGTQTIDFWSTYISPNTGTQSVSVSGTNIATVSPGTAVDLFFDINGEATFTTTYDDAGQLQLNAKHITVDGLTLEGDDTFVSKPVMLAAFSDDANADCASGDASCTQFKRAGELFNLKVNAACWTDDADTDFTDNPVTPNFELIGIATDHNLVAPAGGVTGTRSVSTFNFDLADNGSHTISQSVSEVGVFTFSVSAANYFGETLTFADSPNIGRFYPDHFEATTLANGNFSSACTGFSYSGQSFTYQTKPQVTVTAYNTETPAVITQNYTGDFAKLVTTDFNVTAPTTDATQRGIDATNLVRLNWTADVAALTDNADGSLTFSFGNDSYVYLHEANSRVAPFNNTVDLIFTAITDSDNVQTDSLPYTVQPAGEPIRFGRLNMANVHGSELAPLPVAINAEMFNGVNWVENTQDQCTVLNLASHLQLSNASTSGGSWRTGTSSMTIGAGTTSGTLTNNSPLLNGQATLTLSAPGEDNQGYVDIRSQLAASHSWLLGDFDNDGAYDDNPSGRASFGLFKGSDTIIFRREVY